MKHLLKTLSIALFSVIILSCEEETKVGSAVEVQKVNFEATLSGANETTPNASTETGTANLNFNTDTKRFTIVVTTTLGNLDAAGKPTTRPIAGAHIHKGAKGADGAIVFPFTKLISPMTFVSDKLTPEQEADLFAGLYYVNLHTAEFPTGELRGNLVKK